MPSNLLKLSSASMESAFHNRCERSGRFYSQSSQCSRSRSSNFDDENLKYLTNEEKNVLMFLEQTLDAFEDDPEEPPFSANSSLGYYSPRSTEDGHSDTDDIINLVQTEHNHIMASPEDSGIGLSDGSWNPQIDSWTSQATMTVNSPLASLQKDTERLSHDLPAEHWKPHGAIPTPVIIAQKIFEKKSDSENLSTLSPKDERSPELKKSVGTSPINDSYFIFPGSPNATPSRFPTNIIIKPVGKQYNKTIAKAAVNVQERKAQVLANLHVPGLFADEIDAKNRHELERRTSFRDVSSEQTRYEALTKLGLVKEMTVQTDLSSADACKSSVSNGEQSLKMLPSETNRRHSNEHESISKILMNEPSAFVPLGKTVLIKGELTSSLERNKQHSSIQVEHEKKQINTQEIKRTSSMPRPAGLWPQGITVQFSGRDSTEESRKDALKRLGLLSGH